MADRLTQLQDCVNLQAENFCNSIGVLQQMAQPSPFAASYRVPTSASDGDSALLFAAAIARTAKDIDLLIDSLPGEESAPELQANNLQRLEIENKEAARRLEGMVARGESLLAQIQDASAEIGSQQLKTARKQWPSMS